MRLLPKSTLSSITLIALLAVILISLAVLQYRWSGRVSEAEQERMHTSLLASMNQFRLQLNSEFQQLGFLFQPNADVISRKDWAQYAASCGIALDGLDYDLVRNVYLWIPGQAGPQLLRLNRDLEGFEVIEWPARIQNIRNRYNRFFANPSRPAAEIRPFIWAIHYRVPLMIRPLVTAALAGNTSSPAVQFAGCVLLDLNLETIREELFPELAKKSFGGPDGFMYHVAVVGGSDPGSILYKSDSKMSISALTDPDAKISLMEIPRNRIRARGNRPPNAIPDPEMPLEANPPAFTQFPPETPPPGGMRGMGPIPFEDQNASWSLVAQHRKGSLEAAVMDVRRKNLALSFGSLLLLSLSMALIVVSARRAQRFAQLQMDFVAGISHELRTPLTVICSAGDNLAEGVTGNSSDSARKYGKLIRNEGRNLTRMIEQTLQFASLQHGRGTYNMQPESINRIAEVALKQTKPLLEEAGFSVEKSLATNLPPIHVDSSALSRVIQNLIQNAIKYSDKSHRLIFRTFKTDSKRGSEVLLSIEDEGMGISGEDLPHIFEPFYRSNSAGSLQIRGTGLGLHIVRETLAAMGGSIDVKTAPGKGSTFTIHFPSQPISSEETASNSNEDYPDHAV